MFRFRFYRTMGLTVIFLGLFQFITDNLAATFDFVVPLIYGTSIYARKFCVIPLFINRSIETVPLFPTADFPKHL